MQTYEVKCDNCGKAIRTELRYDGDNRLMVARKMNNGMPMVQMPKTPDNSGRQIEANIKVYEWDVCDTECLKGLIELNAPNVTSSATMPGGKDAR